MLISPLTEMQKEGLCEEAERWKKLSEDNDVLSAFNAKHLHDEIEGAAPLPNSWIKERIRNYNAALVLALNCDVDPPDVTKPSPCARLQAWYDPTGKNPLDAVNQIGSNLQKQYVALQPRARYKLCLDPTVEDVKKLCQSMRRGAKEDRIVFHYNGHGVPRPTENGEIWVFNKNYTQYIPLSIYDLQSWMGAPSVYVFDCHNAERIIRAYYQFCEKRKTEGHAQAETSPGTCLDSPSPTQNDSLGDPNASASRRSHTTLCMDNTIIFAACRDREQLPLNPEMPADLFTSCLTTPIEVALRFYHMEYRNILPGLASEELLLRVPGILNDRRTMRGEIAWLFQAITDTIAWNSISIDLFQRFFRQDVITASLARNFLLAQRVMYHFECNPVCWPNLPFMQTHRLWQSWDAALEHYLRQLPGIITNAHLSAGLTAVSSLPVTQLPPPPANVAFEHTKFFEEQLTAFELWLTTSSEKKGLATQLPVILQVLLSQNHRIRALDLLGRFMDQGEWAMSQALSLSIFPYVVRLLQSRIAEIRPCLTFLWSKILAFCEEPYVRQEIMKDKGFNYFLEVIQESTMNDDTKTRAVFVLARIMDGQHQIQETLLPNNIVNTLLEQLSMCHHNAEDPSNLKLWLILCLSKLWCKNDNARWYGVRYKAHECLYRFLQDVNPVVRAASVYALGTYVDNCEEGNERSDHANKVDHNVGITLSQTCVSDSSPLVRRELVVAFSGLVRQFENQFITIGCQYLKDLQNQQATENQPPSVPPFATGHGHGKGRHGSVDFGRGKREQLRNLLASGLGAGSSQPGSPTPGALSPPSQAPSPFHPRLARQRHSLTPMSTDSLIEDRSGFASDLSSLNGTSGGLRRTGSSNIFHAAAGSSLGGNVYAQLWNALLVLASDPSTEVNKMAKLIIMNIKAKSSILADQRAAALEAINQRSITSVSSNQSITSLLNRSTPGTPIQSPSRRNRQSPPHRANIPTLPASSTISTSSMHQGQYSSRKGPLDTLSQSPNTSITSLGNIAAEIGKVQTELFAWCSARFREPVYATPPEKDPLSPPFQARVSHLLDQADLRQHLRREWSDSAPLSEQIFVQRANFRCHLLRFHPHHDHLAAAERKSVFIWSLETCQLRQTLLLKPQSDTRCITAMHFVNPHEERGLLMTGCDDGSIRIYRNYFPDMGQDPEVITAWMALNDMLSSNRRAGLVSAWTQRLGQFTLSGDVKYVRVWDAEREAGVQDIPTGAASCVTCVERTSDGRLVAIGLGDGSARLLDTRCDTHSACLATLAIDSTWLHGLRVCPHSDDLWALSSDGVVKKFDLRLYGIKTGVPAPQADIVALEGGSAASFNTLGSATSTTSLGSSATNSVFPGQHACWDMHLGGQIAAVGRSSQIVSVHSVRSGKTVNNIKFHEGLLGQRIGSPIAVAFHPNKMVLGIATSDDYVNVFATAKRT